MHLRVSATDLDALRYYLADEDADLADLLARLRRELPPTEAMMAGTALHAALETATEGDFDTLTHDGYTFRLTFDGEVDLPPTREVKETREYQIGDVLVTLVGKVDAIHGRRVDDHKFTSRYDPERFMASMQWRVYLEVFGADEFRWNIFEGRELWPKEYEVRALHHLRMHRYPGIERDVEAALAGFISFARLHLPERFTRDAA